MATKRDGFTKEFREAMNAFQKSFGKLLKDSGVATHPLTFWINARDQSVVDVVSSDGTGCSISIDEFEVIRDNLEEPCLVCAGLLELEYEPKHKPALYLVCNRCERPYTIAAGTVCLKDL